jgi:hypothetical protein
MGKTIALKQNPTLSGKKVLVNGGELLDLQTLLQGIKAVNNSFPPSMAKFHGDNMDKLNRLITKLSNEEKDLVTQYAEKDDKGRNLFWDGYDKRMDKDGNEVPDDTEALYGIKAYFDEDTKMYFDTFTHKPARNPQNPNMAANLFPYVKDEEKRKELSDKMLANNTKKHELHVLQIDHDYLEEYKIQIPVKAKGRDSNMKAFFEYLVIGASINETEE